jgi:hypothetical protein
MVVYLITDPDVALRGTGAKKIPHSGSSLIQLVGSNRSIKIAANGSYCVKKIPAMVGPGYPTGMLTGSAYIKVRFASVTVVSAVASICLPTSELPNI